MTELQDDLAQALFNEYRQANGDYKMQFLPWRSRANEEWRHEDFVRWLRSVGIEGRLVAMIELEEAVVGEDD